MGRHIPLSSCSWFGGERDKYKNNHSMVNANKDIGTPGAHQRDTQLSSGKNKPRGRWNGISELCKRWLNDKRVEREGRGFSGRSSCIWSGGEKELQVLRK